MHSKRRKKLVVEADGKQEVYDLSKPIKETSLVVQNENRNILHRMDLPTVIANMDNAEDFLEEKLREIAVLPYEVYKPWLDLAIGALGLEMNGVYSMLNKMQIEFSHAQEYMERGQQKDVKETLEEYSDNLEKMTVRLGKCRNTLVECQEENEKVVCKVNDFLAHYEKSLTGMKKYVTLQIGKKRLTDYRKC